MRRSRDSSSSVATATTRQSDPSTLTESTSSCSPTRTLREALEAAVYDLATCKPHQPDKRCYFPADWKSYDQGYAWALVMALRVMELAAKNWEQYMEDRQPKIVARINGAERPAPAAAAAEPATRLPVGARVAIAIVALLGVELVALLGALIWRVIH